MAIEKITDKKTIGITKSNLKPLMRLVNAGAFGSELDAAKFAMAHAIDAGVTRGTTEGAETKWNVGTVDSDGILRSVVEALFADETQPYRLVEHLMNEGLQRLDKGDDLPPDVVSLLGVGGAESKSA